MKTKKAKARDTGIRTGVPAKPVAWSGGRAPLESMRRKRTRRQGADR